MIALGERSYSTRTEAVKYILYAKTYLSRITKSNATILLRVAQSYSYSIYIIYILQSLNFVFKYTL